MKKKLPERCGNVMRATAQLQLSVQLLLHHHHTPKTNIIRCDLPPGHEGNHHAQTPTAHYEWWNQEKNPQKEQP